MKRYDEQSGLGVLSNGTGVQFPDGTAGTIVQGFTDGRSLVQFSAGKGVTNRDVYSNDLLKVNR